MQFTIHSMSQSCVRYISCVEYEAYEQYKHDNQEYDYEQYKYVQQPKQVFMNDSDQHDNQMHKSHMKYFG